ncbi:hypothetical protein MPER_13078 [Moniliophthora perniciosa FA553]|nr:hypothetical protein MPER_13078 [Moniliophthora perniciosa FA553]
MVHQSLGGKALDAIRISDGKPVQLKKVSRTAAFEEVEIGLYFSRSDLAQNARNHCVPILEVLAVPTDDDLDIIVMPLLRDFGSPEFDTGIQFMHEHHVAHRDCTFMNIMMNGDDMYPEGWHPMRPHCTNAGILHRAKRVGSRTKFWPKYYLIDFGHSRKYDPRDGSPLERILMGGDRTPPEHSRIFEKANPFPTDVYFLGNFIRMNFIESEDVITQRRFSFLLPLVEGMVQPDPTERLTIDQACLQFDKLWRQLPQSKFIAAPYSFSTVLTLHNPISSITTRWIHSLRLRAPLPEIDPPKERLPSVSSDFYLSSPLRYPEGKLRPLITYIEDIQKKS